MNLSFSTRGWPNLTWDEMVDTALEMGFSGIEVYNLPKFDEMLAKGGPFHQYQTAATVRTLREKKLSIPCFDTSWDLSSDETAVEVLSQLLEVARNVRVPYVVACALTDDEEAVISRLEQLMPTADAPISCKTGAASSRLPPKYKLPSVCTVILHSTGRSHTLWMASNATVVSSKPSMVSTTIRSAPPSASAVACSA